MISTIRRIIFDKNLIQNVFKKHDIKKQKIIIDFSSPNIAKTLHMGNLRSTLYGNFLQKMYRLAGHDVTSINYLGDWGHQFALLALYWKTRRKPGEDGWHSEEEWTTLSNRERIEFLTKAYAKANAQSKINPDFEARAKELFKQMEDLLVKNGGNDLSDENIFLWRNWKQHCRDYLDQFYASFDIHFDKWDCESNHVKEGLGIVDDLIGKKMAFLTKDNLWVLKNSNSDGKITLKRGDGSSLYFTRELAAIYSRDKQFSADQYIYVVDSAQSYHFNKLKTVLEFLGDEKIASKIQHLSYGRIIGLSTRSGKNDSVDFLIDQGRLEAKIHIEGSPTIKVQDSAELHNICNELSKSALIFDIMKRRSTSNYTFSFKGAFNLDQASSSLLQEKYTRLNSLELFNKNLMDQILSMDEFFERRLVLDLTPPAQNLAQKLYEFETVIYLALQELEPCHLTTYLVKLANQAGKSIASLRVHGEPKEKALPRLILFSATKRILSEGMMLLGINPLNRM